jgi:predicted NAD/FAD-dependent oxidoreductase
MKQRIAIIGAGISGLTLASRLAPHADVLVFEKARGVGGRMSTRYAEPFYFDHGTQFFTARSAAFQAFLAPLIASGLVAPWVGKVITVQEDRSINDRIWFEPHYVAMPNMNSLCKHMASPLEVTLGCEVAPLAEKRADGWHVTDTQGHSLGVFDWVIATAPPVQTKRLFAAVLADKSALPDPALLGCYTLMIGWNRPWPKPWMAAKIHGSPLEWVAINSSKPGRNAAVTSMVVHSSNAWAEAHIDDEMAGAETFLRATFEACMGIDTRDADYFSCHRWRYALVEHAQAHAPFLDTRHGLASSGDWCSASRIEDAWQHATTLADAMIAHLG